MFLLKPNASGFTLIELVIATAIFGLMSIVILSVYIQTTEISRKLQMTRHLTETAREITERIASDVREKGIADISLQSFNAGIAYPPYDASSYTGIGGEVLTIGDGSRYVYGIKESTGVLPCDILARSTASINCGLYNLDALDTTGKLAYSLVDSFVPDEANKGVKITHLQFFISGSDTTEKKVTVLFTLKLTSRVGVRAHMIESSELKVQTTLSERGFQKY